jgi:hypothetical protein
MMDDGTGAISALFEGCSRPLNRPQEQESAVMRGFSWQDLSADDVWKCDVSIQEAV